MHLVQSAIWLLIQLCTSYNSVHLQHSLHPVHPHYLSHEHKLPQPSDRKIMIAVCSTASFVRIVWFLASNVSSWPEGDPGPLRQFCQFSPVSRAIFNTFGLRVFLFEKHCTSVSLEFSFTFSRAGCWHNSSQVALRIWGLHGNYHSPRILVPSKNPLQEKS